jgi:spore coat polysaccharide biosynthesis predicted glycosyltransferase SpsG
LSSTGFWDKVILLWETTPEIAAHFRPAECEVITVPDSQAAWSERSRFCNSLGISILVSDILRVQPQDVADAERQGYRAFVQINDSGVGRFVADMVVDGDAFKSPQDLPPSFQGIALMGAPYQMIRQSVSQQRPSAPWRGDRVERVLVTLGGADPGNLTVRLVRSLERIEPQPSFSICVAIGAAFDPAQVHELKLIASSNQRFQVVESPNSLARLILECDAIVTLGGITSYEVMCLGKPCAAIAWGTIKYYVEQLNRIGLLANLGEIHNAAQNLIGFTKNISFLHQLSQSGWTTIDGFGADRVATEIAKLARKIQ